LKEGDYDRGKDPVEAGKTGDPGDRLPPERGGGIRGIWEGRKGGRGLLRGGGGGSNEREEEGSNEGERERDKQRKERLVMDRFFPCY
jgi:hypothetical protein